MRLPNIISFEEAEYSRLPRSRASSTAGGFEKSPAFPMTFLLQKEWTYHVTCMCTYIVFFGNFIALYYIVLY